MNVANPKFSFIIPVYNAEKKVKKCINSIQKQTYKNIEIVCVNDGSKDNSLEVLKKMQEKDKRIVIVDQKNQGIFYARKSGVLRCSGDYVLFSDNDDEYCNQDTCSEIINILNNNDDVQVIQYAVNLIKKGIKYDVLKSQVFGLISEKRLKNEFYEELVGWGEHKAVNPSVWSKVYEASLLKSAIKDMEYTVNICEDLILNLAVFDNEKFKNLYVTPLAFYSYKTGIGFSTTWNMDSINDYIYLKNYQLKLCEKWGLGTKGMFHCHLETLYFLMGSIGVAYNKHMNDEELIAEVNKAEKFETVKMAKAFYKSLPENKLFDELKVLVYASPQEYIEYVKAHTAKPKNMLQKIVSHITKK